jgi:hypothetical protein
MALSKPAPPSSRSTPAAFGAAGRDQEVAVVAAGQRVGRLAAEEVVVAAVAEEQQRHRAGRREDAAVAAVDVVIAGPTVDGDRLRAADDAHVHVAVAGLAGAAGVEVDVARAGDLHEVRLRRADHH